MAETTGIEWCDHTFNPWQGCTKVSAACDHCYAEAWAKRSGLVVWGGERRLSSDNYWRQPLKWNQRAEAAGTRARVFCASLADVFDNQVPEAWRENLWRLIYATPGLDWLLLTKRPQNIAKMLPELPEVPGWENRPSWHNVWLGTTVENQEEADRRIPHLLAVPADVHFLSCEPLLGTITLDLTGIHWVIAGGETGSGARPSHPDWFRVLRDQCADACVPFFFKQRGDWSWVDDADFAADRIPDLITRDVVDPSRLTWLRPDGRQSDTNPGGAEFVMRTGSKRAGRLLDDALHHAFPADRRPS